MIHDIGISTGIKFVDELKVLGVTFNATNLNITSINMESVLKDIAALIAQWKRRQLTLIGKVTIIKTLLIPKLVHLFMVLPNPPNVILKRLNKMIYTFFWNSKAEKVKRTKLALKYEEDGVNMIDIIAFIKSLKVSWLRRLRKGKGLWTEIAKKNYAWYG